MRRGYSAGGPEEADGVEAMVGLNVANFVGRRETDMRPRANAVPIMKMQPMTAQMPSAKTKKLTSM